MNSLTEKRAEWLEKIKNSENISERDFELLSRASAVFENNIIDSRSNAWGSYRGILPSPGKYDGVWNWDSAFHALALSRIDPELAYEQIEIFLDFQGADGIFPDVIYADGTVKDNYSKPPVFPWAFVEVYRRSPKPELLPKAYESFCRNLDFWNSNRRDKKSGLYYYDCRPIDGDWKAHQKWESGMDDSPRWDNGVSQWLAVDLNGYMATFYDALSQMAEWLGLPEDKTKWQTCSAELKELVNRELWDSKKQCFADRDRFTGEFSDVLSSACFVPLFGECSDAEHAELMAKNAENPERFYPSMPTVAFECEAFNPTKYWRGPVWLNLAYFAAEGLRKYGYSASADRIKEHVLSDAANEKRDIFEYYNARTGEGLGAKSFGWSAAFIIEFILNTKK